MNQKLLFILNPCAGTRQIRKFIPEIVSCFSDYGYLTTVCVTTGRGDATAFVVNHASEMDLVVCAGGDGTYNETVTGLMRLENAPPIGYIPAGSTNDFAASLHLSLSPLTAAEDIMLGQPRAMDVGRINGRVFTYVASFGAFTRTSYATPQSTKNMLGHMAYILEGVKDLPSIHPEHLRVEANGRVYEDDYLFGAVSNSLSLGGILTLDPTLVDMNDGVFEVMLIRSPKNALQLQEILFALRDKRYDSAMLDFFKASQLELTMPAGMDWSLDGEYSPGAECVTIENIHNAIALIVNERTQTV